MDKIGFSLSSLMLNLNNVLGTEGTFLPKTIHFLFVKAVKVLLSFPNLPETLTIISIIIFHAVLPPRNDIFHHYHNHLCYGGDTYCPLRNTSENTKILNLEKIMN